MENQSLVKMAKKSDESRTVGKNIFIGIEDFGEDIIQNILGRLPALTFAWAACVSRSWNSICKRNLLSPKLTSAVSFNASLEIAVNEVLDKVLSKPIQPHFALASIGPAFSLEQAHQLIAKKLGSKVSLVTNVSEGVIGRDLHTNNFVEVQWEVTLEGDSYEEDNGDVSPNENPKKGIILTVGFLPGLKAHIVPLWFKNTWGMPKPLVESHQFVTDVRGYASAVSDSESPAAIMFFADRKIDMKPVLQKMEFAFSPETAIVGAACSKFLYRSNSIYSTISRPRSTIVAAALLFARDKNKPSGIGETNFYATLSTGLSPVGLTYKACSVKCYPNLTCLTASNESLRQHLDGETILEEVYDELGDHIVNPTFYVGVTKRRKCSVGEEKVTRMRFFEFHGVAGGDEEYLFVESSGIRTGDPFRFYISDSKAAISSSQRVSNEFKHLLASSIDKRKVFGGIVFSCCGRGDFGKPGIDSSPFLENFPEVTFGGTYCAREIGRGNLSLYDQDHEEGGSIHCFEHFYSAVYLVMSYCPPPQN